MDGSERFLMDLTAVREAIKQESFCEAIIGPPVYLDWPIDGYFCVFLTSNGKRKKPDTWKLNLYTTDSGEATERRLATIEAISPAITLLAPDDAAEFGHMAKRWYPVEFPASDPEKIQDVILRRKREQLETFLERGWTH